MSNKNLISKILGVIVLSGILGIIVYFGAQQAILGPALPEVVMVGPDSSLDDDSRKALFDQHSKMIGYPEKASDIFFHLEPANYASTEICGEFIRFKAEDDVIDAFVVHETGTDSKTDSPSPYVAWHYGVGGYDWWLPEAIENAEYYEKGQSFITVDRENKTVYYSCVIRGKKQ